MPSPSTTARRGRVTRSERRMTTDIVATRTIRAAAATVRLGVPSTATERPAAATGGERAAARPRHAGVPGVFRAEPARNAAAAQTARTAKASTAGMLAASPTTSAATEAV